MEFIRELSVLLTGIQKDRKQAHWMAHYLKVSFNTTLVNQPSRNRTLEVSSVQKDVIDL